MPENIIFAAFPHSESVVFGHGRWWVEEGRGRLYSKGERLQRSEPIQTNIAAECRGENIFLHHGIEAHGVHDVEPVRRHFSPKGRHSRCTRLYRAYLDDLGGYPESQEEPAESVWLDLANAYGSVPHQLLWKTLEAHHVPQPVIHILQEYFSGFMMRFSTKTYTTRWVPLEVGIATGCTISPSPFVLAMQILLKAAGSNIPEAHIGKGVYMPPIKAFMDDTTLIMNRKKVVQNTLNKLNNLLGWCRMAFKPAKSRSHALVRGKIRRDMFFDVAEQRIPTVSEEPVKSLGRVFDESLTDKSMRGAILQQTIEGLQAIEAAPLKGRFKVWLFQFVLLPRLLWPLTSYEIGLSVVEKLERKVNRYTRKWLGLPPALSSVALNSSSTSLRLPLRSIVEEYKLSKIRTQRMLNNSADSRIREVKPLLRPGRKFRAQNEIDESVAELTFEEVRGPTQTDRHAVGWNHLPKWSQASSSTRAAMIN